MFKVMSEKCYFLLSLKKKKKKKTLAIFPAGESGCTHLLHRVITWAKLHYYSG